MRITTTTLYEHTSLLLVDLAVEWNEPAIRIATFESTVEYCWCYSSSYYQRSTSYLYYVVWSQKRSRPDLGKRLVLTTGWGVQYEFFDTCIRNWCLILIGRELEWCHSFGSMDWTLQNRWFTFWQPLVEALGVSWLKATLRSLPATNPSIPLLSAKLSKTKVSFLASSRLASVEATNKKAPSLLL